ncbi:MAG: hypothetical protein Q7R39_07560 [Dehalococcoidia bacterium]|nr:hypothetical protein [Dehalococcoidia bacterium]
MGNRWVVDPNDYLMPDGSFPHGPAATYARYFGSIVSAASLQPSGTWVDVAVKCRRRAGGKPCAGNIRLRRVDVPSQVEWGCTSCDDSGLIHNWRGSMWDLSGVRKGSVRDAKLLALAVSWEELRALRKILLLGPETQAVLDGAVVAAGVICLQGPEDDIEELAGQIAFEANHTRSVNRQRILDRVASRVEALLEGDV